MQQPLSGRILGKILSAILLTVLLCQLFSGTSLAQAPEKSSTNEDVAIAFFKTGGVTPDFTKWAMKSDKHATVQKAREKEYLEKELRRYNELWNAYDPARDMIAVKATAAVSLGTAVSAAGEVSHSMTILFDKGAADYFPFQYQDYMIAVIPQKLNQFLAQSLPPEQFNLLQASFDGKASGRAVLYFLLKPVKADMSRPYEMDGHEQWMFVTDIAGLSLKNARGQPLWNYTAPWYVTPTTKDVRDMFIQQEDKEKADDAAEGIRP